MEKKKGRVLKLEKDDPQKELEFDVECALEEDPSTRLDSWWEWNLSMLNFYLEHHGHQETRSITKRV